VSQDQKSTRHKKMDLSARIQGLQLKHVGNFSFVVDVFGEGKKSGKETKHTCHFCGGNNLSVAHDKPYYKCFNCGKAGDYFDYFRESNKLDFVEASEQFCALLGEDSSVLLGERKTRTVEEKEKYAKQKQEKQLKADIFNQIQAKLTASLNSLPDNHSCIEYLFNRGIRKQVALQMGIGLTCSSNLEEINKLLPDDQKWGKAFSDRITLPLRDGRQLQGYSCRKYTSNDETPKYLITPSTPRKDFLSELGVANIVVITEGYLDALRLNHLASGTKDVKYLGLGSATASSEQAELIMAIAKNSKVEKIVLALDDDKAGFNGVLQVLKLLNLGETEDKLFVFPGDVLSPFKDPDAFVFEHGYDLYHSLIEDIEVSSIFSAPRYLVMVYSKMLYACHALEIESVLKPFLQYFLQFKPGTVGLGLGEIKKQIEKRFESDSDALKTFDSIVNQEKQKKVQEQLRVNAQEMLKKAEKIANKPDFSAKELWGVIDSCPKNIGTGVITDIYFLEDYPQHSLLLFNYGSQFDEHVTITPGGLHVVAAKSGNGKTNFLLNSTLLQLTKSNTKVAIVSYEETVFDLLSKLLIIGSGVVINKYSNIPAMRKYLSDRGQILKSSGVTTKRLTGDRVHPEEICKLITTNKNFCLPLQYYTVEEQRMDKKSKQKHLQDIVLYIEQWIYQLETWMIEKRLIVSGSPGNVDDLSNMVSSLKEENGIDICCIDYLQLIPTEASKDDWRKIKKISNTLRECALSSGVAVLAGSQLNREINHETKPTTNNLREGGDIEQDAHLVLALWKLEQDKEQRKIGIAPIKNRNANNDIEVVFTMDGAKLQMKIDQ